MVVKGSLYWADQLADKIIERFPTAKLHTVAAGITPSGTIHIGHFREMITTDIICRALRDKGKKARFIYSWDDYDRIRKVPKNIPNPKAFEKYMYMPGVDAPDPWGCHKSYTEHFEKEAEAAVPLVGIHPQFIYQSKMYRSSKYADEIKFVLENRFEIRKILNKYRKEPLPPNWYPAAIYCKKCNREQTQVTDWDGEYTLTYSCNACKSKGETNFKKEGLTKLPWRVDWAMRWRYEKVTSEGGGKEHNTPGGSLDTGHDLCKTVFHYGPPVRFMYDYVIVKSVGGKMSSSLGNVIKLSDALEVYLPEVVRYMYAGRKPVIEFSVGFDEDVLKVYEDFYRCERIYFGKEQVIPRDKAHWSRVYEMSAVNKPPRSLPIQPAIRTCVEFMNIYRDPKKASEEYAKQFKVKKKADVDRILLIMTLMGNWLAKYAPDRYRFELQENPTTEGLSVDQREALKDLAKALGKSYKTVDQLIPVFGNIAKAHNLTLKEFFPAVYQVLINRERGPRLAPFVLAVGKNKIAKIINKALTSKAAPKKQVNGYKPVKDIFEIQKEVLTKFPGLKAGIAVIRGVNVQKQTPELEKLKKQVVGDLIKEFKDKELSEIPVLAEYKRIYRATGVDPTKRKPSPLALLLRVKKGQDLYTVNTLVDVYNLAVMKTQVSMGAFDMKNLNFPTYLRFSKEGEQFTALMADKPKTVSDGELVYADKKNMIFCRDLNYRDSDFTKITDKTKDTILYVDGTSVTSEKELKDATELAVKWILKYCGGKVEKIAYTF
ncbi:lysine--tRNA ligase [Candidatus Woesearchaeota archaeon]|jgi:lysyl-tRNA synthetase, class I|nr:lysine--tRNA ligase [Candidatus Woesearchaeota archaeon]MBT4248298.1 lysine--tRNA ligase [Candidatus Woesearchaeota archaeon]